MSQKYINNYKIIGYLKSSGISELLLAKDQHTEKIVVIKRPLLAFYDEKEIVNLFKREAEILKSLQHENICNFIEYFEKDQQPFIVIEYLHGKNLKEIINESSNRNIFPPSELAAYIGLCVCRGLSHAHALAFLHRDISPTNIFITVNGKIKILDFGIAIKSEMRITDPSIIKGKIRYISPEQLKGDSLDQRTDIFSLGVCLYEFATTSQLFKGKNIAEIADHILHGKIQNIKKINKNFDPDLDRIILKLLERDRSKRYDSAFSVQNEIKKCLCDKTEALLMKITANQIINLFPSLNKCEAEYKKFSKAYLSAEELGEETTDRVGGEEITIIQKGQLKD